MSTIHVKAIDLKRSASLGKANYSLCLKFVMVLLRWHFVVACQQASMDD
jgi:hypothetical protein